MNTDQVILFPTTHEQSLPTFHVRRELRARFVAFLEGEGFRIAEPPEPLEGTPVTEVLLEAGTPMEELRAAKARFLESL